MARKKAPRLQLMVRKRFIPVYDSSHRGEDYPENLDKFITLLETKRSLIPEAHRKSAEFKINCDPMMGDTISVEIGYWADVKEWGVPVPAFIHVPD